MARRRKNLPVSSPSGLLAYLRLTLYSDANVDMSEIQLKAEDLYDKEKVDLENIVIEDVFQLLQCDEGGLTTEEAQRRIEIFGPNKLETEEQNAFLQVRRFDCHLALAVLTSFWK